MFLAVFYNDRWQTVTDRVVRYSQGRQASPPPNAYYRNCSEAWAAGVAPLYAGEPGYRPEMDGDNDGIACEPYRGM
jgi:hypothetical protein